MRKKEIEKKLQSQEEKQNKEQQEQKNIFTYEHSQSLQWVKDKTDKCQKNGHMQQVAYSSYHRGLTQICFTCKKIRSNIKND